jgi:hypothetical protein
MGDKSDVGFGRTTSSSSSKIYSTHSLKKRLAIAVSRDSCLAHAKASG